MTDRSDADGLSGSHPADRPVAGSVKSGETGGGKVEIVENPIAQAKKKEEEEAAAAAAKIAAAAAAATPEATETDAAPATPTLTHSQIEKQKRITEIYKYYSPKQLPELPLLFEKFAGNEDSILLDLEKKYPATRRASAKIDMSALYGSEEPVLRESENSMAPKDAGKSIIPFSSFTTTTVTVPDPKIWLYLDDGIELGPFTTADMLERSKSGTYKDNMQIKQSHWSEFCDLRKVFPTAGEEFSYTPPEPKTVSDRPAVKAYSAAPRPMRKGSIIPIQGGSMLPPGSV